MTDSIMPTEGQIVPDILQGWRYKQPCRSCGVPVFTANCHLVCPFRLGCSFKKYEEAHNE